MGCLFCFIQQELWKGKQFYRSGAFDFEAVLTAVHCSGSYSRGLELLGLDHAR
jgi:hypothetical protein